MLRESLVRVLAEYPTAARQSLKDHPLAAYLRGTAADDVAATLDATEKDLKVQGSAGVGNWAGVPWIAVFALTVTDTATRGYYVVYLFHASARLVHLSLNQGTTAVRREYGRMTRDILRDRASIMKSRLSEYAHRFPVRSIGLGSRLELPGDYEAGHVLGTTYQAGAMPTDEALQDDLRQLIAAYRALTFRGGIEPSIEENEFAEAAGLKARSVSLLEMRQYRLHRRIERNPLASKAAKRIHGYRCQCCSLDFAEVYGGIGAGYIEAHHLRPLAKLVEGEAIRYNLASDFAVLCANCHRMIHRLDDSSDIDELRRFVLINRPAVL